MTFDLSPIASKALLDEISKDLPELSKIERYISEGADINYQSEEDGYTALMLAVDRDDEPLVNYLLQQGANPLIHNHHKEKASEIALSHSPIYQLLKNHELLAAAASHDIPTIQAALDSGADVNFQGQGGYTALIIAVEESCIEIVEFLIKQGADIDYRLEENGYTTLMFAVNKKDELMATFLIQQGVDLFLKNHLQQTASDLAEPNTELYKLLKNHELLVATQLEDSEKVKDALAKGADINFQGKGGYTAIMIAVKNKNLNMVELLITYKPNFYRKTDEGLTINSFADDNLILKTLQVCRPLTSEEKEAFLVAINTSWSEDEERYERGRLKMLADRNGQPFKLSQLGFKDIEPPASEEEIEALHGFIGHPLPELYKNICRYFNGGDPKLCDYDNEDGGWNTNNIGCFFQVNNDRTKSNNIWNKIENFSSILAKDVLPFAGDHYGLSIFYLKWEAGNIQVWRLLYGDLAAEIDEDEFEEHGYVHVLINESFDAFLESLYAAED
ncbi:MAG: ankyrin repeat domain-containing protein [Tatlockia sp.]|nr:ankyrin repeat domain-containing protein [Tatlockia sp.]